MWFLLIFLVTGAAVERKALGAVVMLQSECASGASAVVTLSSEGGYGCCCF